jgi:predicted RND superfamily exporter protein
VEIPERADGRWRPPRSRSRRWGRTSLLAGMLTTSIGFCSATVMWLPMSTSFGLTMGAAIALVYALTMFALPALVVAGDGRRRSRAT